MELELTGKRELSSGVASLTLQRPDRGPLPTWRAGAHLELSLPGGMARQYSLCGDAQNTNAYELAVLREPAGRGGSAAVHDLLRTGDRVQVRGPRNHFELASASRYLFIAGGIGVTPILPMLCAAERAGADWRFLYGGRSRSSMAFLDALAHWGERVQIRPQDECGLLDVEAFMGQARTDTLVYSCGPAPLLAAVQRAGRAGAWKPDQLRMESFGAAIPREGQAAGSAFSVVLARSGVTVAVEPGQSILAAIADAGIHVASSCGTGVCGTCESRILEGIPDHRDSLLSETEKSEGQFMLICVSRASSACITLDL
ncbi:PDR/VanB family oxidoreductase [Variovorax sp. PBS-H4]|uniref:PDR/VanB family oxidoreductase n=1 Tax=Variovorax sp. PBS-H4 TaxID=434008 RepID=UPI0013A56553|nr:PDR/VanB family oxidoreductase [Variovorax sp. PBS-H4]